jgi:AcrR family transcriptional regulator
MPKSEEANQEIREQTTKKILEAARKVFARKGSAATMAEVAVEAGVSQGLAYRYFPSKEAILTTIVKQSAEADGGPAERIKKIRGTPAQRLAILISYLVEERRVNPEYVQAMYQVITDDTLPNDLRKLVAKNGKTIQDIMLLLIIEGQEKGEIARDDPEQLLAAIMACINGLVRRAELLDREGMRKHFPDVKIFLRMLRPDPEQGVNRN